MEKTRKQNYRSCKSLKFIFAIKVLFFGYYVKILHPHICHNIVLGILQTLYGHNHRYRKACTMACCFYNQLLHS